MKKNKLAIFDLDGTLFDTSEVNFLAYNKALNNFGLELEHDFFVNECNGRDYKYYLPLICPETTNDMLETIHTQKKQHYREYIYKAKENSHLFNIIINLKHSYHIALVTTASKANCLDILNYFNRERLFDLIITQEDVINKKPNPEGFLKAMGHFDARADKTLIFEDSEIGIEAAIKAGAVVFKVASF